MLRPYAKPTDILWHLGEIHNLPDFAEKRLEAEQKARTRVKNGEVNIDEIYVELSAPYNSLKKAELSLEK